MRNKSTRVKRDFRFPSELIKWAEDFAGKKNKSLTQLLIDQLTALRDANP